MTAPTKYRKRPVVIEAIPFTGEPDAEIELWLGDSFNSWLPLARKLEIQTLEGLITASAGDLIIKGVQGEFYPCKPDIFEATYEAVEPAVAAPKPDDCPHASPFRYCDGCKVKPCPIGLGQ